MTYRLAADIGGTFTDIVLEDGNKRLSTKVLTTPQAPELGLLDGIDTLLAEADLSPDNLAVFIHGTTLATNALIERKGAKTAFLTTAGFKSLLDMGYEKRFDHYDLTIDPVPPIVPATDRYEVEERLGADGTPLVPLDEDAVRKLVPALAEYDAIAIGFLHSFSHSDHERRVADILQGELGDSVTVCRSSEVCPEIREYERFVTTCANALVRPLMAGYLARLDQALAERRIDCPRFLMMSGGGLTTFEQARRFPIRLVESGPAGGAILAGHIARQCALKNVLSFDMGGTTAKICLLQDGEPERARLFEVARSYRNIKGSGWPVRIPVIDMVEIGAGGGSIARLNKLGQIAVGPDSAGAEPGPVAYGRGGTEPTVTDANLVLGKIVPEFFAGGQLPLDAEAGATALSEALGLENIFAAAGTIEIVEENMANAARVHAVEKGRDLTSSTMVAFGGGAPLHACRLADKLGIDRILVPQGAGVGSAIGFLRAAIGFEATRTNVIGLDRFDAAEIDRFLAQMEDEADKAVHPALGEIRPVRIRKVAMRYVGQGHELEIPLPERPLKPGDAQALRAAFERQYREAYGVTLADMAVETVAWSVQLQGPKPDDNEEPSSDTRPAAGEPPRYATSSMFDSRSGEMRGVPVYRRSDLPPSVRIKGPAIIAEAETSTIVTAGFDCSLDARGYLNLVRQS